MKKSKLSHSYDFYCSCFSLIEKHFAARHGLGNGNLLGSILFD